MGHYKIKIQKRFVVIISHHVIGKWNFVNCKSFATRGRLTSMNTPETSELQSVWVPWHQKCFFHKEAVYQHELLLQCNQR